MRDRGSMLVFTVLVGLAFTASSLVAMVVVFEELGDRQRAQNAADAAALAGVLGGRDAASELAAANDAVMVSWSRGGREVTVTVRVGRQTASARATDAP